MDFELPEELRMFKAIAAALRRHRNDPDRAADHARRRREAQAGILRTLLPARQGSRLLDDGCAGGIRRRRPFGAGALRSSSRSCRARSRCRRAAGAALPDRRVRDILYHAQRRDEGKISAAGAARREESLLRADRARRRLRSGRHAHHRGARRRPLRHQRRQALHHRRRRSRFHAADGGDRSRQGLARRHFLFHRRHGHAGREARRAILRP